jgi:hypothetical protein
VSRRARYNPFYSGDQGSTPSLLHATPSGSALHAGGYSSHSPGQLGTAQDTFFRTSVQQTVSSICHEPRKDPPVKPGPGAQRTEILEYIKQQLDCYGKEPLLMNQYHLLGPDHRATGGSSLLAFIKRVGKMYCMHRESNIAVKAFARIQVS